MLGKKTGPPLMLGGKISSGAAVGCAFDCPMADTPGLTADLPPDDPAASGARLRHQAVRFLRHERNTHHRVTTWLSIGVPRVQHCVPGENNHRVASGTSRV